MKFHPFHLSITYKHFFSVLKAAKTSEEDVQKLACSCFRLNSLQMAALLSQEKIPRNLIDTAIRMAESVADELTRGDDREVCIIYIPPRFYN